MRYTYAHIGGGHVAHTQYVYSVAWMYCCLFFHFVVVIQLLQYFPFAVFAIRLRKQALDTFPYTWEQRITIIHNFKNGNSSIYMAYALWKKGKKSKAVSLPLRIFTWIHVDLHSRFLSFLFSRCALFLFIFPHCRLLIRIRTLKPATLLSNMYFVHLLLTIATLCILLLSISRENIFISCVCMCRRRHVRAYNLFF